MARLRWNIWQLGFISSARGGTGAIERHDSIASAAIGANQTITDGETRGSMNFACIIRIKDSDKFLGSNLKEVERSEAPILRHEAAESLARKRFGNTWQDRVVIEEVPFNEWMAYIGSIKRGNALSDKQKDHLQYLHDKWNGQWRLFKLTVHGKNLHVGARSARVASEYLNSKGVKHTERTFWRKAREVKRTPYFMVGVKTNQPIAFMQDGKKWRKLK